MWWWISPWNPRGLIRAVRMPLRSLMRFISWVSIASRRSCAGGWGRMRPKLEVGVGAGAAVPPARRVAAQALAAHRASAVRGARRLAVRGTRRVVVRSLEHRRRRQWRGLQQQKISGCSIRRRRTSSPRRRWMDWRCRQVRVATTARCAPWLRLMHSLRPRVRRVRRRVRGRPGRCLRLILKQRH